MQDGRLSGSRRNPPNPVKSARARKTVSRIQAFAGSFPSNFLWGTATSAYQIEGAVNEDERGPSIWDRYAHTSGKILDKSSADVANDHYHRYKEDVQLIKAMGVKAYRFSIAWPRVFPEGAGSPNPKGLDFYNRLLDELLENGIEPFATLYHWDLPQALGARRRVGVSRHLESICGLCGVCRRATERSREAHFHAQRMSRFLYSGYGTGMDAPGLKLPQAELNQALHNVALGHGLAVQAIRAHGQAGTRVGPAERSVDLCARD